MPKLERSQWYDLSRDMNWRFKYVTRKKFSPKRFRKAMTYPRPRGGTGMSLTRSATANMSTTRQRRIPPCTLSDPPSPDPSSLRTSTQAGKRR